jgi:hypothetical protein
MMPGPKENEGRTDRRKENTRKENTKIREIAPILTRRPCDVIAFPVFERYGFRILEWLTAIGEEAPPGRTAARVVRSIRFTTAEIERVRNSSRHSNLATFLRHAANAMDACEWRGATYILMTALACLEVPSARSGHTVRQLPLPGETTASEEMKLPPEVVMGIVTG